MKKIFILGLDGLTWDIIKPLIKNGKLPCFEMLLNEGCHAELESCYPPFSPPAWTSIVTGKNPGKHGIFDFQKISPNFEKTTLTTSIDKKSMEIWDYLSAKGLKSIVINLPYSYPPKKINGIMITGMTTPSIKSEFVIPTKYKEEILKNFPDYKFDLDWIFYRGKLNEFKTLLNNVTIQRRKIFEYFLTKEWNLFFCVFIETDRALHILNNEDLSRYLQVLDQELEMLIKKIDKNFNVIFVSDHGFHNVKKKIFLNKLLEKHGFLSFRKDIPSKNILLKKIEKFLDTLSKNYTINKITEIIPIKIMKKISSPFIEEDVRKFVDWGKTKTFAFGSGFIYLNKLIVSKEERVNTIYKLKTKLSTFKDPETGELIFDKILNKEEAYNGPFVQNMPELIVIPKKGYTININYNEKILDKISFKRRDHDMNGLFLAYGPDFKKNIKLNKKIKIYDIAPTVLYIMNIPIPIDMDGRILHEIFNKNSSEKFTKLRYYKIK